jgi:hypothetical protein
MGAGRLVLFRHVRLSVSQFVFLIKPIETALHANCEPDFDRALPQPTIVVTPLYPLLPIAAK